MEELEHSTGVSLHATTTEGYQWRRCSATGVTSESLLEVETVSATLKEAILDGKDVNLASLLISLFDLGEYSCYAGGSHHLLRLLPSDPHLNRNLTLAEFISAFNKYRKAMCEVWDRRKELDAFKAIVVGVASRIEEQPICPLKPMMALMQLAVSAQPQDPLFTTLAGKDSHLYFTDILFTKKWTRYTDANKSLEDVMHDLQQEDMRTLYSCRSKLAAIALVVSVNTAEVVRTPGGLPPPEEPPPEGPPYNLHPLIRNTFKKKEKEITAKATEVTNDVLRRSVAIVQGLHFNYNLHFPAAHPVPVMVSTLQKGRGGEAQIMKGIPESQRHSSVQSPETAVLNLLASRDTLCLKSNSRDSIYKSWYHSIINTE
ncbi:hypothetical protein NP493_807g01038 [Ridgeia piscesae]|uniref:Uncharacterized protein n=1 Tax=Ridgeia piscesae TaxID=27915 RepID=A0AAD9KN52_RIDPI|nr:hypothetical protein NP493_807g01038 [Ridgeia piscesae]